MKNEDDVFSDEEFDNKERPPDPTEEQLDLFNDKHFEQMRLDADLPEPVNLDIFNDEHFNQMKLDAGLSEPVDSGSFDGFGSIEDVSHRGTGGMFDPDAHDDLDWSSPSPQRLEVIRVQQEYEEGLTNAGWIKVDERRGKIVPGDTIRLLENVFDKEKGEPLKLAGSRTTVALISRESHGKQLQHRIYITVIESSGENPYPTGKETYKIMSSRKNWFELWRMQRDEQERELAIVKSKKKADKAFEEFCDPKKKSARKAKKKEVERDEPQYKPSACEQKWVESEWYQGIVLDHKSDDKHGKWDPAAGWNSVSNSNDQILIGDIIRFVDGVFSGYYPKTKFAGTVTVVAEVTKIGNKYCYLRFISSPGANPYKTKFRISFKKLYYWEQTYRLRWKNENLRRFDYPREFSSTEEYLDYIKLNTSDSVDESDDDHNGNEVCKEKDIIMIENLDLDVLNGQIKDSRNIYINRDGYYRYSGGKDPVPVQISNFILKPVSKIIQGGKWWFECKVYHSCDNIDETIILSRDDFRGSASFKNALSIDSRLEYYGNSQDTTRLQGLMTDYKPPKKVGTNKLGLHNVDGNWIYVEGHNVSDMNGSTDKIVYTNNNLSDDMPCILGQPDISQTDLKLIATNLNQFNDPSIVYIIVGWIGFCFTKERLADKVNKRNPILMCEGEPGSGKTETISQVIQPTFSNPHPITNAADATKFTFAVNGCRSNMVPFHYDEWKKSIMQGWQVKNLESMLLAVFNQTTLPRGCTNQRVNDYRFTAPLILSGEMTLDSPSLRHRIFDVFFSKRKREGRTEYFKTLCNLPLGSFGKGLLLHMLSITDEKLYEVFDQQKSLVDSRVDDRFEDNAALVRVGLWLIMDYFQSNGIDTTSYNEGFEAIDVAIVEMMTSAQETNVDRVISDFSIMSHTPNGSGNWLNPGVHYEVHHDTIVIKIAEVYARYQRYAKRHETISEPLGKHSLLQQIETKPYYIEKKTARIGGKPCHAICLDLTAMPDFIDTDFAA